MADHIPVSSFSAQEGMFTSDLSNAGAPAIMAAILELIEMFDKTATHVGGDAGGIGALNIKDGAVTDTTIGNRTIDDAIATALSDTGTLNELLSFIAKQLKALAGTSGWKVTANETVNGLDTRVDAIEAIQIDDINGLNNGSITISGGAGVDAHITVTVDAVTKTITLTPVGTMIPAAHASSHAPGGLDSLEVVYSTVNVAKRMRMGVRI